MTNDITLQEAIVPASGSVYRFKDDPYSSHTAMLKLAGSGQGRRLLDVGAADGFLARRFAQQGWQVTAIEQDAQLASQARPFCEEVVVSDLNQQVPSVRGPFGAIVYGDVLEHLVAPEAVFQRLNESLAEDGMVIVSMPNVAHLWVRLCLLVGRFDYTSRGILDETHLRFFTLKTFRQFLRRTQLHVEEFMPIPAPLFLAVPPRFQGRWLRLAQWLNALGARWWPTGMAAQFVVKGYRR